MNAIQKGILFALIILIFCSLIYPPFQIVQNGTTLNMGYGWILNPPIKGNVHASVNVSFLLLQWIAAFIICGISFFLFKNYQPKQSTTFIPQISLNKTKIEPIDLANTSVNAKSISKKILSVLLFIVVIGFSKIIGKELAEQFITNKSQSSLQESLKKAAENLKKQIPLMVDENTRLDNIEADENKLKYFYTLPNRSSQEITVEVIQSKVKDNVCSNLKTELNMKKVLEAGGVYTYIYNGNDGIKITEFSIDNKTCSNFSKSSLPPKTENQVIKWGEPVTLSGVYSLREFDNCCFLGETKKSKYHHLELDNPIDIDDKDQNYAVKSAKSIELAYAIERFSSEKDKKDGGKIVDFSGVKNGDFIQVKCEYLRPGDTGHYALFEYCVNPSIINTELVNEKKQEKCKQIPDKIKKIIDNHSSRTLAYHYCEDDKVASDGTNTIVTYILLAGCGEINPEKVADHNGHCGNHYEHHMVGLKNNNIIKPIEVGYKFGFEHNEIKIIGDIIELNGTSPNPDNIFEYIPKTKKFNISENRFVEIEAAKQLPSNIEATFTPTYNRVELPHGISLEIPTHWEMLPLNTRKNLTAYGTAIAKNADIDVNDKKENLLAVNSVPKPQEAMIRVSVKVPDISHDELIKIRDTATASEKEDTRIETLNMFKKAEPYGGIKIIEMFPLKFDEKINGYDAYSISYTREGVPSNPTPWIVVQYKIIISDSKMIEMTLSYRQSSILMKPILEHVKRSIHF